MLVTCIPIFDTCDSLILMCTNHNRLSSDFTFAQRLLFMPRYASLCLVRYLSLADRFSREFQTTFGCLVGKSENGNGLFGIGLGVNTPGCLYGWENIFFKKPM